MPSKQVHAILATGLVCAFAGPVISDSRLNEDATLSTPKLIKKYGYPSEVHTVTTEDGYILELHRIPFSPKSPAGAGKPVAFLQHGLASSSADWVLMGTESGLGYILADLGYDVWLANSRGNTYSRKHLTLDPDAEDNLFWNFSFHEMGFFDVPASIDLILTETGQKKMFYVGHSQGTALSYVLATERPEYNDKLRAIFSLAPVSFISHARQPIFHYFSTRNSTAQLEATLGIHEVLRHTTELTLAAQELCSDGKTTQQLCVFLLAFLAGYDPEQVNTTMLPVVYGHFPAGASSKQFLHFAQEVVSKRFCQYDYGLQGNLVRYGRAKPPNYDLTKMTAPVSLHYGTNDWLVSLEDVEIFYSKIVNPIGKFLVPFSKFNHVDFLWAKDVKALLYDQLTDIMAKY